MERSFGMWDMVALWIGLVVCIPSWFLATSLVEMGAPPTCALCPYPNEDTLVLRF